MTDHDTSTVEYHDESNLPRELAPGVFWLGRCSHLPYQGDVLHQYSSVYFVVGDESSVLVEAGFPQDTETILEQLEGLIRLGAPEPERLFVTHGELPHSGGTGWFLRRFPDAIVCGGVSDLHLVFPQLESRIEVCDPGDRFDLGGTELVVVEAVFRDLAYTRWFFDTRRRVLFCGDGFAFSHYHRKGHCGRLAEETEHLRIADEVSLFALAAFYWTRFVDIEPYIDRLRSLIFDELDVQVIAPTHGLPIGDTAAIMPEIERGLRLGTLATATGSLIDE